MMLLSIRRRQSCGYELMERFLGVVGAAAGAYAADRFLDRFFGRSHTDSNRPRVR